MSLVHQLSTRSAWEYDRVVDGVSLHLLRAYDRSVFNSYIIFTFTTVLLSSYFKIQPTPQNCCLIFFTMSVYFYSLEKLNII